MLGLLGLLAALALAVGMIAVMVGSMRAGLLPRWLSVLGILSGLLFLPFFGTTTLQLIPTFWLVATGISVDGALAERRPAGLGRRRGASLAHAGRDARKARSRTTAVRPGDARGDRKSASNGGEPAADIAPAPTPVAGGSRRKRRKRG